jgi:uncharacterized membrane protein YgcG
MNNSYDILEICLQEMENGVDLATLLERYPDIAAELEPLLRAVSTAKLVAVPVPSLDVLNRNRAKVLRRFDQVWDAKPVARNWFPSLRLSAVAFMLLVIFLISGTSVVRAAYNSLPGDTLYSVKRSWEDASLFFIFNGQARENLEIEYRAERLEELNQLFASGRTAQVDFFGVVTGQLNDEWRVSNISVIVSAQTELPKPAIKNGDTVHIFGVTRGDGFVLAEKIELVSTGTVSPDQNTNNDQSGTQQSVATSEPGNENDSSEIEPATPEIETPQATVAPKIEKIEGTLISINQNNWKVNAFLVDVSNAEIVGTPAVGAGVRAEGYFAPDGLFMALQIEIIDNSLNGNTPNSNDNAGNTDTNINGNDNTNDNSNGSNDNGGSGGGGNDSNANSGGHSGNGG